MIYDAIDRAVMGGKPEFWNAVVEAAREQISAANRFELACAFTKSCEYEDGQEVLARLAPIFEPGPSVMSQLNHCARSWAERATVDEKKAYAAAIWNEMDGPTRAGFVAWMQAQINPPSLPKAAQEPPL